MTRINLGRKALTLPRVEAGTTGDMGGIVLFRAGKILRLYCFAWILIEMLLLMSIHTANLDIIHSILEGEIDLSSWHVHINQTHMVLILHLRLCSQDRNINVLR